MQGSLAAMALAEIEGERLPSSLVKTLESLAQIPSDMHSLVIARGLAESVDVLETTCQGAGVTTLQAIAMQAPGDSLSLIRQGCKTDRFKLVTNPGPGTHATQYLLAHVALSHLQENGGASADEKALLRYLATAQAPAKRY